MKKFCLILILATITLPLFGCKKQEVNTNIHKENDIKYSAKIENNHFQIYKSDSWQDITIKGVNISYDGELKEKDYYRYFEKISEMNANTIRVYELQNPEFYIALDQFNKKSSNTLYFFQGIPMDEDILAEIPDVFKLDNIVPFKDEIETTIDAINGKAKIAQRDGQAFGKYSIDVSHYLLGWIIGNEWNPLLVDNVNKERIDKVEFEGNHFHTEEARAFENFLAEVMDHTLSYELSKYNWTHPISFLNWPTTDFLTHLSEPKKEEDMVKINPNSIKKNNDSIYYFASYDIYPYYPDFLNLEPKYTLYMDHRGKVNNFAGYINDLVNNHEMPILVSEFGLPTSRALEHINIHGLNKGFMTEEEQGEYIVKMFQDIIQENCLGGIIFSWSDNWDNWSNALNSEEQFGILSLDRNKIKIDGDIKDWKNNKSASYFTSNKKDKNLIKNVFVDHDERYLYLNIQYSDLKSQDIETNILIDSIKDQGNYSNPFNENIIYDEAMDFIIRISQHDVSKILLDNYYNIHHFKYKNFIKNDNADYENKSSEGFSPIKILVNESTTAFKTGLKIPFNDSEVGILNSGNGNPESSSYNSLSDYFINKDKNLMEIRIPWALLGFTDPSKKEIQGDFHIHGLDSRIIIDGLNISVSAYSLDDKENYFTVPIFKYTWDNWEKPVRAERLKESYKIIKEGFSQIDS